MCFNEYIAYQCGHRSTGVVRPCPLTTTAQNLAPCAIRAVKQSHALTMCVPCERVLHFRWILVREFEHRWMHERGVCGCDVNFPGILYAPRVSGDVTVSDTDATGKQPERGSASNVPAPYTETSHEGEHHVSVRIPGLYAAEWIADHKQLHETGACHCGISFDSFQPSVQAHELTPAERSAIQNLRRLESNGANMTHYEITARVAEITRLFGVFMPVPAAPQPQRGHGPNQGGTNNHRSGQGSANTLNNHHGPGQGQNRKKRRSRTQTNHPRALVFPPNLNINTIYPGHFAVPPPYPIVLPTSQPQAQARTETAPGYASPSEYQAAYYMPVSSASGPPSGYQVPFYMPVSSTFHPDPTAPSFPATSPPTSYNNNNNNNNNQFGPIPGSNSGGSSRASSSQTAAPTPPTLWAPYATELPGSSPPTLYGPGPYTTTGLEYMYPPVSPGRSASAPPDLENPLCGLPVGAGPEGTSHVPEWSLCRLGRDEDGDGERSESPSAWSL